MSLPLLTRVARRIRHLPGLGRLDGLWRAVRPAYHFAQDPFGRGVAVEVGQRRIRLPAPLLASHPDWTGYEVRTFARISAWLEDQAGEATFLDIGSSFGVITSFVLQTHPHARVIAFDGDAMSLRSMDAVVPASAQSRLLRVLGLLGTESGTSWSLETAAAETLRRLPPVSGRDAITRSTYVCIGGEGSEQLPHHRLDDLLREASLPTAVLLKCDVEGAELLVLEGAREFLARHRPELLLSVHPRLLPRYGHDERAVERFLQSAGYEWTCYDRDHEEHWHACPRP